jgi:ATP-dependent protease ClpP protease subunit
MTARQSYQRNQTVLHDIQDYCLDVQRRTIFLHGHISESEEDPGVDYRMSSRLIKNLHLLTGISDDPITIHLQSIGGIWHEGMAIYDAIKTSSPTIKIIGHGSVSSMGTIIMQAASERLLMPHAEFMIHYGEFAIDSNSVSAKTAVDWNERCNQTMLEIYVEACYKSPGFKGYGKVRIQNSLDKKMRMRQEWYLSAKDAIKYGFIDGVIEE